ncbi:hypothetical protein LguiA_005877 [Lonicera macranthoides]
MGKKLNALLPRRTSKTSKLESLANLAISRIRILKNQRYSRFTHAESDVIQLLNHGDQSSALLRVEYVIKEQNAIEAFVMIGSYCLLLTDSVELIQNCRKCPDQLKETISSLIFAASRCGEFPELQKIRENLASQFGNEFAACAVELRNNCGVNPMMIQKLSTRQASLESRQALLVQIASENGIPLHLKDDASDITKERHDSKQRLEQTEADLYDPEDGAATQDFNTEISQITKEDHVSDLMKASDKYSDVAAAAQELFDQSESSDEDPDDHSLKDIKRSNKGFGISKMHPSERSSSESECEEMTENSDGSSLIEIRQSNSKAGQEEKFSPSEFESEGDDEADHDMSSDKKSDLPLYEFSKIDSTRTHTDEN